MCQTRCGLRSRRWNAFAALLAACASTTAPALAYGQVNVAAHYADGQVWVHWTEDVSPPETYAVYIKNAPFTSVNEAQLVGRLFREEWLPLMLQAQASGTPSGWVIPDGISGRDTLAADEGLFVHTPLVPGDRWYAVVRWGDTTATAGVNLVGPVSVTVSPADPPEPQLQHEYVQDGQWLVSWYAMWAHGQDDHLGGRPDFPVMANRHKNGMPSLFLLSRPTVLPAGPRPLVHWLHGGSGTASQSRPGTRTSVYIDPEDGFLCAHNDDFIRYMQGAGVLTQPTNSWHFGWTVNHDPFDSTFTTPALTDSVINYTQRRYTWIHNWLLAHFPIDSHRVAVQGHSVGSAGTTAWAKAYPELFSTATVINNGFMGPGDENGALDELPPGATTTAVHNLFGARCDNLPTNLRRAGGEVVRAYELFDHTTPISPVRDLPLFRSLHGKHDVNAVMQWDAHVVAQYRGADSLALGAHLYWDERDHSLGAVPSYFSHGDLSSEQTERDNVVYQGRYRNDVSYPAFFNHRLYPNSHDPGDGTKGTTADSVFSGDDWGTWGGFHDWPSDSITDEPTRWECDIWLIDESVWLPDNCPYESLITDVTIRRPNSFRPSPGTPIYWCVTSTAGDTLQDGFTSVTAEGLAIADSVVTPRAPDRRRLHFTTLPVGVVPSASRRVSTLGLAVVPMPVRGACQIMLRLPQAGEVRLTAHDVQGRTVATLARGMRAAGLSSISWRPALSAGVYHLRLEVGGQVSVRRVVVIR